MLLFTNDVLEMALAKSKGKGTTKYWNRHTFHIKSYTIPYIFPLFYHPSGIITTDKTQPLYRLSSIGNTNKGQSLLPKTPPNNWQTHAQHVMDMCISAAMQSHNSCCALNEAISFKDLSYIFQRLFIPFPTTYIIYINRHRYVFHLLLPYFRPNIRYCRKNCLPL